eukprot:363361-Chlamydomonas_euryale.AAC.12
MGGSDQWSHMEARLTRLTPRTQVTSHFRAFDPLITCITQLTEWHNLFLRRFELFYYPETNEVEMVGMPAADVQVDVQNLKTYVKMSDVAIRPDMLQVGAEVKVYNKKLTILRYGDEFTRSYMEGV